MGIRRFKQRLINPIFNIEILKKEYNIVDFILKNQILENNKILKTMADLDRYERKIIMGTINNRELLTLYNNIKVLTLYITT